MIQGVAPLLQVTSDTQAEDLAVHQQAAWAVAMARAKSPAAPAAALLLLALACATAAEESHDNSCGPPYVELRLENSPNISLASLAPFGQPPNKTYANPRLLTAAEPLDACQPLSPLHIEDGPVLVLVTRGNCTFLDKALAVQNAGGAAMLMFDDKPGCIGMGFDPKNSSAPAASITIPCLSLGHETGQALLAALPAVRVSLSLLSPINAGTLLLLLMGVATTVGGALWAGADDVEQKKAAAAGRGSRQPTSVPSEDEVMDISMKGAVFFVFLSSAFLLLLFFLMNQVFFYILLVLFCFGTVNATAIVGEAVLDCLSPSSRGKHLDLPWLGTCPVHLLASFPASAVMAVVWAVFRKTSWAWVLQDILGIALMLLVLRTLRLNSLRVACVLLPLAFAYDIFWVFISPYFFGGTSVMVEVAEGGSVQEALPMLLKVPDFSHPELGGYSMLGFGDIILPGLLVAYTRRVDLAFMNSLVKGYFLPCSVGYAVGLCTTYAALMFSWFGDQGQPALLYLVPCTLGTVVLLAAWRGELSTLMVSSTSRQYKALSDTDPGDIDQDVEGGGSPAGGSRNRPGQGINSSRPAGDRQQGATLPQRTSSSGRDMGT